MASDKHLQKSYELFDTLAEMLTEAAMESASGSANTSAMTTLANLLTSRMDGSQSAMAVKAGVSQTTVSAWLRGESLPPSTRLPALAAALNVPLSDLATMVARERSARLRRRRRAGGVVAGHAVASSCRKSGKKAARSPGHKAAAVAGAAGGREVVK